jgi:hypothetical protein
VVAANRALAAVVELAVAAVAEIPGVRAGAAIQADRVGAVVAVEIPVVQAVVVVAAILVVQAVVVAVEIPGFPVVQVDRVGVAAEIPLHQYPLRHRTSQ